MKEFQHQGYENSVTRILISPTPKVSHFSKIRGRYDFFQHKTNFKSNIVRLCYRIIVYLVIRILSLKLDNRSVVPYNPYLLLNIMLILMLRFAELLMQLNIYTNTCTMVMIEPL